MSIDVFHPDPEQEFLIMNALRGHPEDVICPDWNLELSPGGEA